MTNVKEQFMIESISKDIVLLLIKEQGMSLSDALHTLYTSDTYTKLQDTKTGLYSQSTAYNYEYLVNEIKTGKMI